MRRMRSVFDQQNYAYSNGRTQVLSRGSNICILTDLISKRQTRLIFMEYERRQSDAVTLYEQHRRTRLMLWATPTDLSSNGVSMEEVWGQVQRLCAREGRVGGNHLRGQQMLCVAWDEAGTDFPGSASQRPWTTDGETAGLYLDGVRHSPNK